MLSRQARTITSRAAAQPAVCASRAPLLRTYATPASSQDTKPPVTVYGIDGTYASALYTAAVKTSSLDPTARALNTLSDVFKKDVKLPSILSAPSLTPSDKSQIVQELQRHMGNLEKADTVKQFLKTLAENNRLGILEGVCDKFGVLMGAARGELEMVVQSASKLDPKTLQRLETAVSKSEFSQGKRLKMVTKINPDVIGGLIVEIGDRTIDLSVSAKIAKMNKLLSDTL